MATRAEMQAELEALRAKMAEMDEQEVTKADPSIQLADVPAEDMSTDHPSDAAAPQSASDLTSHLTDLLSGFDVSAEDIEDLAQQLWKELDSFPQRKPIVTAVAAFALGVLVGRMTK